MHTSYKQHNFNGKSFSASPGRNLRRTRATLLIKPRTMENILPEFLNRFGFNNDKDEKKEPYMCIGTGKEFDNKVNVSKNFIAKTPEKSELRVNEDKLSNSSYSDQKALLVASDDVSVKYKNYNDEIIIKDSEEEKLLRVPENYLFSSKEGQLKYMRYKYNKIDERWEKYYSRKERQEKRDEYNLASSKEIRFEDISVSQTPVNEFDYIIK